MKRYIYKIAIWPVKLYWFIFRPQSHGVKCIIEKDNKILLIKNTYGKGWWNFPGGGINKNESPEQAVTREIKEELNLDIINLKKLGVFLSILEYKKDNVHVYRATPSTLEVQIDKNEISEYQWVDPTSLPQPISRIALRAIELWRQ